MPRPSLKNERTEEILEAYERCVARYGVEGSTLERIADEAGLARALIRHNVGNKDQLLGALIKGFLEKSKRSMEQLVEALPQHNRIDMLIEWLFDAGLSNSHEVQVASALIIAAKDRPKLAKHLRDWNSEFVGTIEQELVNAYSTESQEKVHAVAAGIAGIYFNVDTMSALGHMSEFRSASKNAAVLLLSTLNIDLNVQENE